jgi:hypothetical protein
MIITTNRTKTSKIGIVAMMSIAVALIDSVIAFGDGNMAFATKNSNDLAKGIEQHQDSEQNAQCVAGEITFASCNNLGFMFQHNEGNLALGQR